MPVAMIEPDRVPQPPGEAALVRDVALGGEEAVARLYAGYADDVFRFIYRRVEGRYEDAQDLTLEVFLAAVGCASSFDPSKRVFTWLCGLAKLRITDYYRRMGRGKRVPPGRMLTLDDDCGLDGGGIDDLPERLEMERLVDRIMGALREDEREALLLRYVEGFSVREMAKLLRRSEKGVESLLIRAKRKAARAGESAG